VLVTIATVAASASVADATPDALGFVGYYAGVVIVSSSVFIRLRRGRVGRLPRAALTATTLLLGAGLVTFVVWEAATYETPRDAATGEPIVLYGLDAGAGIWIGVCLCAVVVLYGLLTLCKYRQPRRTLPT
jgi:hypothetical protein